MTAYIVPAKPGPYLDRNGIFHQTDSKLEREWMKFFDDNDVCYEYEPWTIELMNGTTYTPDFYLPNSHTVIELKYDGFQFEQKEVWKTIIKLAQFQILYGDPEPTCCIVFGQPNKCKVLDVNGLDLLRIVKAPIWKERFMRKAERG